MHGVPLLRRWTSHYVAMGTHRLRDDRVDAALLGGAIWLGGVAGLALPTLPGVSAGADRRAFWSPTIRRFSATAMSCVATVALSGLFLH